MGKKCASIVMLAVMVIVAMGAGALAGSGSFSVNYWAPEVNGLDTSVAMEESDYYTWTGVGDPVMLRYPNLNGLEFKGEWAPDGGMPIGFACWSMDRKAKLDYTAGEDNYLFPRYVHPDWSSSFYEGNVKGEGKLDTSLFDLWLGRDLLADGSLSFSAGLRNFEITRTEKLDFTETDYYWGQTVEDKSESSMWGPMVGLKGRYGLGSFALTAGFKVGLLTNSQKVSTLQYEAYYDEGSEPMMTTAVDEDDLIADTYLHTTNPVLTTDLDLAVIWSISERWELELGYRSLLVKDGVARIIYPDDVNETMTMLETSDLGLSGGRVGLVYHF